jgi:hypothetical protein
LKMKPLISIFPGTFSQKKALNPLMSKNDWMNFANFVYEVKSSH